MLINSRLTNLYQSAKTQKQKKNKNTEKAQTHKSVHKQDWQNDRSSIIEPSNTERKLSNEQNILFFPYNDKFEYVFD